MTNEDIKVETSSVINELRQHTGQIVVTANLPPLTKRAKITTEEINADLGANGRYDHELLPAPLIKKLTSWASSARYLREKHGVKVGNLYLVALDTVPAIECDIAALEEERDKVLKHTQDNWGVVMAFVDATLGNLKDEDMKVYGTPIGYETFKKDFGFQTQILPIPVGGVDAIPAAFVGETRAKATAFFQNQDAQFVASMGQAVDLELKSLLDRFEARARWFEAGGLKKDEPTPRITEKFVVGVNNRIMSVGTVSAGVVPSVKAVTDHWASVGTQLVEHRQVALDSLGSCQQFATAITKLRAMLA